VGPLLVFDPASTPFWRAPSTHGSDRPGYRPLLAPLPPQRSTPQKELGSILLVVQNREPPWPHQCSLRKPRESTPNLAPSSRQGSNPLWEPYGIPRTLFSWRQHWAYDGRWWWQLSDSLAQEVPTPRGSPCQGAVDDRLLRTLLSVVTSLPSDYF